MLGAVHGLRDTSHYWRTIESTMRLLDVNRLELCEFSGSYSCPKYAILSHRWGDEEITFQSFPVAKKDVEQTLEHPKSQQEHSNTGRSKIAGACTQARKHGLDYL